MLWTPRTPHSPRTRHAPPTRTPHTHHPHAPLMRPSRPCIFLGMFCVHGARACVRWCGGLRCLFQAPWHLAQPRARWLWWCAASARPAALLREAVQWNHQPSCLPLPWWLWWALSPWQPKAVRSRQPSFPMSAACYRHCSLLAVMSALPVSGSGAHGSVCGRPSNSPACPARVRSRPTATQPVSHASPWRSSGTRCHELVDPGRRVPPPPVLTYPSVRLSAG